MKLDDHKTIAVFGDRNTGKTNLVFNLLKKYTGKRKILLYAYPKELKGYGSISSLQELARTTDSIIFMDELQQHVKIYDKRHSNEFLGLLALMSHNNNTLIFTTPLSQFINKTIDGFIDGYLYTKIGDIGTLKNGSKAKRLLQSVSKYFINEWTVNLPLGKALFINAMFQSETISFNKLYNDKHWRS